MRIPRTSALILAVQLFQISQPVRSLSSMSRGAWKLQFDNRALRELPVDPIRDNYCRTVPNSVFSLVNPTPVRSPKVVAWSPPALSLLGLSEDAAEADIAAYLSGNELLEGSEPAAHCYCGHQFGSFAGQLGDGAAILLGEVINSRSGERWELQLKGAGKTPYSRSADGRKVLRSSIREFLCSESMHFLGVPTTRAVSCITSASTVERDPFYDGNVIHENCTVVARLAPTFLRFGSFEIFKPKDSSEYSRAGPSAGNEALKEQLLQFVLTNYYPELQGDRMAFLRELTRRTAALCAKWQAVGFVHGVLNTDNMSILGLTIDYGPFAFMEQFDPDFVPNGSDNTGRYSYAKQPSICAWNLQKLVEALEPLVNHAEAMQAVQEFDSIYQQEYMRLMRAKLGLIAEPDQKEEDRRGERGHGDEQIVAALFETMLATRADFTDTFVAITEYRAEVASGIDIRTAQHLLLDKLVGRSTRPQTVAAHFKKKLQIHRLGMPPQQIEQLERALSGDGQLARQLFGPNVPIDLLRDEVSSERRKLDLLMAASQAIKQYSAMDPDEKAAKDKALWSSWLETYFARVASQASMPQAEDNLVQEMRSNNPTVILRSWMAQVCIESAEKDDFEDTRALLRLLFHPYEPSSSSYLHNPLPGAAVCAPSGRSASVSGLSERERAFLRLAPSWADSLYCTCSS